MILFKNHLEGCIEKNIVTLTFIHMVRIELNFNRIQIFIK